MAAIHDLQLDVTDRDIADLFLNFDHNNDGKICYLEFILTLRGDMSKLRSDIVENAFQSVDKSLSGQVDIRDLKRAYIAKNHPVVLDGRMTESKARMEFYDTFDKHHSQEAGFNVTFQEF